MTQEQIQAGFSRIIAVTKAAIFVCWFITFIFCIFLDTRWNSIFYGALALPFIEMIPVLALKLVGWLISGFFRSAVRITRDNVAQHIDEAETAFVIFLEQTQFTLSWIATWVLLAELRVSLLFLVPLESVLGIVLQVAAFVFIYIIALLAFHVIIILAFGEIWMRVFPMKNKVMLKLRMQEIQRQLEGSSPESMPSETNGKSF